MRPRLLDLFCKAGGAAMGYHRAGFEVVGVDICKAGGAAMGYHRAGFEVVGVDIEPQPHYPFEFIEANALDWGVTWSGAFAAVHASPPCQAYSAMRVLTGRDYPDLIPPTRALLQMRGLPFVIENVEHAPLRNPVTLCGTQFGIKVRRHRLFECSFDVGLLPPHTCRNGVAEGRLWAHKDCGKPNKGRRRPPLDKGSGMRDAIECYWMTAREARQAVPPAYTEWLGGFLMREVRETS